MKVPLLHENNNYIFAYANFGTTVCIYECIPSVGLHRGLSGVKQSYNANLFVRSE